MRGALRCAAREQLFWLVPKRKRAERRSVPPVFSARCGLQRLNVRGLQALGAADDFKLDRLAVVQRLVAIRLNCGEMDENVLSALALDEAKALAGIEPLDCSLFFTHFSFSSRRPALGWTALVKLFGAPHPNPVLPQSDNDVRVRPSSAAFCGSAKRAQKKAASLTLRPLHNKGDTRATNAHPS